jgi:hypothetical protein
MELIIILMVRVIQENGFKMNIMGMEYKNK